MTGAGAIGPAIVDAGITLRCLGLRRGWPDPRGISRPAQILHEVRPDILQTWLYHADLLGLVMLSLGQAPRLVWGLHASDAPGVAGLRHILAWASGRPDAVVTVSQSGRRFHESVGYHPRQWVHIPNGFDTQALRPDAEARRRGRKQFGIADDAVAILLPARYHPIKDHKTFLAAAAALAAMRTDCRFFLAGSETGPGNRELASAVASHGLAERLTLLGERGDLDALYPAFDIVTLSSSAGEAMPLVLGEAMACGIACVATDIGDCAAVIGDTGIVVPPRDPSALAAAWQHLLALGPEARQLLGARARDRVLRHYALDVTVSRYAALYEEIADN